MTKCTWCGNPITDPHEIANLSRDTDGDIICDECHRDEYMQECTQCEGYYNKSECDKIGALLIVFDADEAGVAAGVYEIIEHPWPVYDWVDKLAIRLLSSAMTFEDCGEIIGHMCPECAKEWRMTE